MSKRLRRGLRLGAVLLAVPILAVGGHLGIAAWNDPDEPLPPTQPELGCAKNNRFCSSNRCLLVHFPKSGENSLRMPTGMRGV